MKLSLSTLLIELHKFKIAKLGPALARKLAVAVAGNVEKRDLETVTVEDLLACFPMRYEDRSNFTSIDRLGDGMEAAVEIHVKTAEGTRVGKNRSPKQPPLYIFEIRGADAKRSLRPIIVKWFVSGRNADNIIDYYSNRFRRGTRFVAYGKWDWNERQQTVELMVTKPDELEILPAHEPELFQSSQQSEKNEKEDLTNEELFEDVEDPNFAPIHSARRVPVYRKLGPFQTKKIREIIHSVLENLDPATVTDYLPSALLKRQNLLTRFAAMNEIHFPPDDSSLADYEMFRSPAQRRIIFEEFFWLAFSMGLLRGERRKEPKGTVIEISDTTKSRLKSLLPFNLTNAQKKVIGEIFSDLKSDAPMNRLVQGDVGSGKTIVAFLAMFAAMENGYQTALMAPTEILAEQHVRNARRIFENTGYKVELLIGSMKAAEKRRVQDAIAAGEVNMVIGTHAVIQDNVRFDRLGLAVIDEQHRFGVLQRAQLRSLGLNPDILVMTATPIPRSLAMVVYGDLEVSIIDELPPGRTPIKTVVVGEDQRRGVYRGIEREINLGRQAFIVYPLIEESEKLDLKAAKIMYEDLKQNVFPNYSVGLLHGKMKPAEKDEVMREFVAGNLNILVSTTVIEVGVDIPNASLMVIEHAERFGLSQLHQLRGRVGRGADQSYCVLLAGFKTTAVAKERLGIMEETSDGFKIAEKDLEIRGQGEILGTRQSGIQNFKMGNIVRDLDILSAARTEAENYLTTYRTSRETAELVKIARSDKRFRLAGIG